MENPVLSVCCTTFNHEKYIRKAMDGFLMQKTDFPFEIVVHDDASTDRTQEILREYQSRYPDQIRLILQKENQYSQGRGPSEFINPALRGTYIALCEGDDYWSDENKLQLQVDYMRSHPECSLTAHQAVRVNEQGEYISPYSPDQQEQDYDMDFHQVIGDLSRFPTASMVFHRDFFTRHEALLQRIPHFDYAYKLLLAGVGTTHIFARSMSAYRVASTGSWTQRMAADPKKYIAHIETAIRTYEEIDGELQNQFHGDLLEKIRGRRAELFEFQGDLRSLRQPEYRPYYKEMSASTRLSLCLRYYLPGLYRMMKGN